MEKNKKFTLSDYLRMQELIFNLRSFTIPLNEHVSQDDIDALWLQLQNRLTVLVDQYKDDLIDKESIEQLTGKEIISFEKRYDDKGVFTGVNIVPCQAVEFICVNFTIKPTQE